MKKRFLECGKIVTTHGVRGEVKVQPWCDSPDFLLEFDAFYLDAAGRQQVEVAGARVQKSMVLLALHGVDSLDEAVKLRGRVLYLDREEMPPDEGEYFVQDLLGLRVEDADSGFCYGSLSQVFSTGANDVYEITGEDGVKRLVPAIKQVVLDIDTEAGLVRIRPLKGLFDDAH